MFRRLEDDMSWMTGYSLVYENCFHSENLVSFRLCPGNQNSCSSECNNGGEYLVDLIYFIDAFTEAQMNAQEYRCEMIRENCDNDDEDQCYYESGANYCIEQEEEAEFNIQEYLECTEIDDGLYVGPFCAQDNFAIHLGTFVDEDCTQFAQEGAFENAMGYSLPYGWYTSVSIIESDCAQCSEHAAEEDQNEGDQNDDDDVIEQCENLYAAASKCEENLEVTYPDTSSCAYLETLKKEANITTSNKSRRAKFLIGFFVGALASVAIIGSYFCLHQKQKTTKLNAAKQNLI